MHHPFVSALSHIFVVLTLPVAFLITFNPDLGKPSSQESPPQVTLVDSVYQFQEDGYVGDVYPRRKVFANWVTPVNYRDGRFYVRVEVLEKPDTVTPTSLLYRVCSGPHHDRSQNRRFGVGKVVFTRPGTYRYQFNVADGIPLIEPDRFNWEVPIKLFQVVCADADGQMVSKWETDLGKFTGAKTAYFPLKVHYTAILVAKGSQFRPPSFWN